MRSTWSHIAMAAAASMLAAGIARGGGGATAKAKLVDREGRAVGTVALQETPHGVLLHARLEHLPPGAHAFHIHAVGQCTPPFKSAGGHFNPFGKHHGILNPQGMHAGDLPNIHVPASGRLEFEVLAPAVTLAPGKRTSLFDADGSAIVIHRGPDDYRTDPAGAAGPRIACGVIER